MILPAPPTSTMDTKPFSMMTLQDLDQAQSRIHSYPEIRLFIAGTANFGHQASSVDLLLRLVCDYAYAGLITVVYDQGNPRCGINVEKLPRLLQRYIDPDSAETLPQQIHLARIKWFSIQDFSESNSKLVCFGLTGGAEIGRIYHSSLADILNVRIALIAQPFQWPWCRDGIDFHSTSNLPPVDLLSNEYLGWRLFHTAYRLPQSLHSPPSYGRPGENDGFLRCLLALKAQLPGTSLSCVYGLRDKGASHVDPGNLLYIYLLALLDAFSLPNTKEKEDLFDRQILVINFDKFWSDAFVRLEDYIYGHDPSPTSRNSKSLPRSGNISQYIRCVHKSQQLPAAASWFREPLYQTKAPPAFTADDIDHATCSKTYNLKILYVHVGFVSPELFVDALKQADLPIIFEGQHTASVVASLGNAYIKLQDSVLNCPSQVLRIPDDTHRHSDVIDRITSGCLNLQRGALGEIGLQQSIDCVVKLVAEYTDSAGPMKIYLNDLKSYYQKRGADKFEKLLSAWNRFGCLNPPKSIKSTHVKAAPRKNRYRTLQELELDYEMVRKMLSEFSLADGPMSEAVI